MRILIIEDEKHNAARLNRILQEMDLSVEILGVLETVHESVNWFEANDAPDVVLMDIRLADGLSFDIFNKTNVSCPVIFTTAYDEYAVRAFKVNSIDYLLKPIEKEELRVALERVKPSRQKTGSDRNLLQLLQVFKERTTIYRKRFLLPSYDGFKTVSVDDIDFVYSEFKQTRLSLTNATVETVPQSMEDLEDELDPDVFFRANRQFIISVNSIKSIHNELNGKLKVTMKRDEKVDIIISRDKASVFKAWLNR